MSGSKAIRLYTSDTGVGYAVVVDESNASATVGAGTLQLIPIRTVNVGRIPVGLAQRYVLCTLISNPRIRRKFKVGNPALVPALIAPGAVLKASVGATSADGIPVTEDWTITAYRGEKVNLIAAIGAADTGLTDGTP